MLYGSVARVSAWILVWFRKLGKKDKIGEQIRISRCLEKRDSEAVIYFCID